MAIAPCVSTMTSELKCSYDPSEHTFLHKIAFNNVIQEVILSCLSPIEFLRFGRTCRLVHSIVKRYIKRAFDINRFLARFFPDPVAFRKVQARTGTLLSGSSALQYLDRSSYPESDLDLYVPAQSDVQMIGWLVASGYSFIPATGHASDWREAVAQAKSSAFADHAYGSDGIRAVFTFSKPSHRDPTTKLKVQCIIAERAPMELVLQFHSTCVMNVISYEMAYSLYPRASVHNHRTLVCEINASSAQTQAAALKKYEDRGFTLVKKTTTPPDPDFPAGIRFMGDAKCWSLPLDMAGMDSSWQISDSSSSPQSQDAIRAVNWNLYLIPGGTPKMLLRVWRASHLHWGYIGWSAMPINYARKSIRADFGVNVGIDDGPKDGRRYDDEFIKHCISYYRRYAAGEVEL